MLVTLMALLFVAASAWMTRPLWRRGVDAGQRRRAANVVAYRQRLAEIQADQAAGIVDTQTAASLRAELDMRLLRDAQATPEVDDASRTRRSLLLTLVLPVLVLAVAAWGYFQEGSWKLQQMAAAPQDALSAPDAAAVEQMVASLARKLEQEPDDPRGWALLGRSYFVMQRYAESARAYARANEITGNTEPELLVGEGEALGMAQERDLRGRPQELFQAALTLAPGDGKALWYAGLAAAQEGDAQGAKAHWEALSKQDLPEELRAVVDERLSELDAVATPPPAAGATPVILLDVRVAPALQDRVAPDATLFVFAKAEQGPPMPLAVYRGKAAELPRQVRLDDSMAMTPQARLSSFERWSVTARISRAGQTQAVSGDLEGSLTVTRDGLGESALALVIDRVVP